MRLHYSDENQDEGAVVNCDNGTMLHFVKEMEVDSLTRWGWVIVYDTYHHICEDGSVEVRIHPSKSTKKIRGRFMFIRTKKDDT